MCFAKFISIHAPTRGATCVQCDWRKRHKFQSTLPREERQKTAGTACRIYYFNPRSHERSDQTKHGGQATLPLFQSTLPREERRRRTRGRQLQSKFQSTLPREERLSVDTGVHFVVDFNPRSHERSDQNPGSLVNSATISIHAPTRGATGNAVKTVLGPIDFNPRSHERSDQQHRPQQHRRRYFNPRSHERSDEVSLLVLCRLFQFQSTLPREERRGYRSQKQRGSKFQSTLPREERLFGGGGNRQ